MKLHIALLATLALVIVGCSSTGTVDGAVLASPAQLSGPFGGMAAEVTGVLVFDDSTNCLRVELEGVQYPLVWPAGTRWQEDPPVVLLKDGAKVEPGMTVYGSGGYLYRDHVEELSGSAVAEAAERCAGSTGEIAFFNRIRGRCRVRLAGSNTSRTTPAPHVCGGSAGLSRVVSDELSPTGPERKPR